MFWGKAADIKTMKATYPKNYFVLAPFDYYYLDCGYGNKYGDNSWCDPFKTWWTIYKFEPTDWLKDRSVLGGEVPAWSEMFDDWNIHTRIWPRAAAMADKLWSEIPQPLNLAAILDRLNAFASKLNEANIPTSAMTGTYCEINNAHCFGHYGVDAEEMKVDL